MTTTGTRAKAASPEDLTRLYAERLNAGDAEGIAELYEDGAVLAVPPGGVIATGRSTIRAVFDRMFATDPPPERLDPDDTAQTLRFEDLALTTTRGNGGRAQVSRRQPDGTWLRILDHPEPGG